jgi:hypothetical protein
MAEYMKCLRAMKDLFLEYDEKENRDTLLNFKAKIDFQYFEFFSDRITISCKYTYIMYIRGNEKT